MTSTTVKTDETNKSTMKETFPEKRNITDKYGFVALLIVLLFFGLPPLFDLISDSKVIDSKTAAVVNSSTSPNVSDMMYDTLSSAFRSLNNKSLIYLFVSQAIIGFYSIIPILAILFSLQCSMTRMNKLCMPRVKDYRHHFAIVSAGKIVSILIFLTVVYFCWTDRLHVQKMCTVNLASSETILLLTNIFLYAAFKSPHESFKTTLKYYINHGYLILFQFLNYTIMLFLIAYVVIKTYDVFPKLHLFPQLGIIFIIYLMHKYGEMVIISSTARHSLKSGDETVSLKTIVSSMIAIARYHFGTIVMNLPIMTYFPYTLTYNFDCDSDDVIVRRFTSVRTMKRLIMFIAVYGQDISKGAKTVHYFENKGHFATDFENKTLAAWADALIIPIPFIFLSIFPEFSISTPDDLFPVIPILMLYVGLLITYSYVFCCTMNTIENTIEFCKVVSNEDIEAMHEEGHYKLKKRFEESIARIGTIKLDVKQGMVWTIESLFFDSALNDKDAS